ncbi:MAG: hypothetical protein FJX53_02235 [Alphaproteobacteria bacterium]|nr:hypothetical protein [Alphaproteobacteria bacterium]
MVRAAHAFSVLNALVLVWPAAAENMRTRAVDPLPAKAGSAIEFAERFKDAAVIDALIASNPAGLGEPPQRF